MTNKQKFTPEYTINEKNEIVWRTNLQKESDHFKTQSVSNFVESLHNVGFGEPVKNENGYYCRVYKGDISPTEFDSVMDAYVDCYTYAVERFIL